MKDVRREREGGIEREREREREKEREREGEGERERRGRGLGMMILARLCNLMSVKQIQVVISTLAFSGYQRLHRW